MYISGHIGSGNGSWPVRQQANTWTSCDVLSIEPLRTTFAQIIQDFSVKKCIRKCRVKIVSIFFRPERVNVDFTPTVRHMGSYIAILFPIYVYGMTLT